MNSNFSTFIPIMAMKQSRKPSVQKIVSKKEKPGRNPVIVFIALAIVLITFISFSPSIQCAFTNWDDDTYVTDNSLIRSKFIPIKDVFSTPVALNYHPITMLSLALNYQQSGLSPQPYHLTNLLIHVINTLLVFIFIYFLTARKTSVAVITAFLFGIHPMHVESVTWISERKDVLYVFFFLAALLSYLRYTTTRNYSFLGLCFLLFILSCLSKAMAVVLPLILLLIDYYRERKINKPALIEKVPFFIVSIIVGIIALRIQSGSAEANVQSFTFFQRLLFGCYGCLIYILKFVIPIHLSAFYPYPVQNSNEPLPIFFFISPCIIIAGCYLIHRFLRYQRFVVFGALFFIITIALVLQFIGVGNALMADRYSYLSYIGLSFIVASVYDILMSRYPSYRIATNIAMVLIIGLFSILTYQRTRVWKDSETLWTDVIAKYPGIEVGYKNRGSYYGEQGKFDEALKDYESLLSMNTKDPEVFNNLANIYAAQNKITESLNASAKALSFKPDFYNAYVNRGITYNSIQQFDKAIADFTAAISINPEMVQPYALRGFSYYSIGSFKNAVNDFTRAINIDPNNAAAFYYRGISHYQLHEDQPAISDLRRAQALGYQGDYTLLNSPR